MESLGSYLEVGPSTLDQDTQLPSPTGVVRRINFEGISEDETIRVFLRIKPKSLTNINDSINTKHYRLDGNSITAITSSGKAEFHNEYFFNSILTPTTTQAEVFDLIVRARLREVLLGADTLLFAYGTTGSGKSYTIQGKGSEPGIIPRVLYVIFASIGENQDKFCNLAPSKSDSIIAISKNEFQQLEKEKQFLLDYSDSILFQLQSKSANDTIRATSCGEMAETLNSVSPIDIDKEDCAYSIWISFIEVYNETIFDLLVNPDETKVNLKIASDETRQAYVKGVKYLCVSSWEEAYKLYLFGKHNLHVSPTSQNKNSSRSHCILSIKIIKRPLTKNSLFYDVSCFTICDLAGSERQKKTRNIGARMKESQSINTSLLVLNRCFNVIRSNQSKKNQEQIVPFRESKLTLLFQNSLCGNSGVTMITNISQSDELVSETHQVLKATAVATKIKAKPFVKKTYLARQSMFSNYCSTRIEIHPPSSSDIDEGMGSSLSCHTCVEYKKEIELLKQIVDDKETALCAVKEKCSQREKDLRVELVDKFAKMLDESDKKHKERMEDLKSDHRKHIEATKRMYKAFYEQKLAERTVYEDSSVMIQSDLKEKLLKLAQLYNIVCQSGDIDADTLLDKIIEIKTQSQLKEETEKQAQDDDLVIKIAELESNFNHLQMKNEELEREINTMRANHIEEMCRNEGELIQLKQAIKATGDIFEVCEDDTINVLDKVNKKFKEFHAKYLEQEKMLTVGVNDYTELEKVAKTLERDKAHLEEEIAIKENKIGELLDDISNLNELLAAKVNSDQFLETEPVTVKLGQLTLDDGAEESIDPLPTGTVPKRITRRTRQKTLVTDESDDDPSFFLPVQAATTGKKKKRTTKKAFQLDVPPSPFTKLTESADESNSNVPNVSTSKSRRKLFRKGSLHLGDDEPVQVQDPEMSQQSPHSCMKTLRPRK
ncbi:hypothetical protein O3M35_000860 [Rhynocoris fuscipes]|uniref:Kinesin motor domain-containing protein n=1 Tax=Rhynocoris fuscipes TaxID=488301 RepID=A0AAW1DQD1_9HEMI